METIPTDSDIESDIHEFRIYPKKGKTIAASVSQIGHEKGWDIENLHVEQGRLDEVFRDLTLKGGKGRS